MRRALIVLGLALLALPVWAQDYIRYFPPASVAGMSGDGSTITLTVPILGAAADNCAAVPFSMTGDTNTGVCSSAADTVGFITGGTTRLSTSTTAVTSTVPILAPQGTFAAPSFSFSDETDKGFYSGAANRISVGFNGSAENLRLTANVMGIISNSAQIQLGVNLDAVFAWDGANSIQIGADAATASAQVLSAADSTGAGVAGASLTLSGGVGGTFGKQGPVIIDPSSTFIARHLGVNLVADATVQFGQTVMPDASADGRFDVTTGSATLTIGVLGGVGASAAASTYPVITEGLAYIAQAEDQTITRGHYLLQSSTAGYVDDSATVSTDGLNIGLSLYSEPVTYNINPTGCTGGAGCINTALNTPNSGPAGQITLDTDVAAAGWAVGQPVIFWNSGGTTPTGLADGGVYFLASVSTTNVTIAATYGGAVVVPSSQGDDGTQYLARLPQAIISIR